MIESTSSYSQVEPKLLRREDGGWLAVSPSDAPIRIGVAAWSAEDARNRFASELGEWVALLDGQSQDDK